MEGITYRAILCSFIFIFSISTSLCTPHQYQTLILTPLPNPPTLSWPYSDDDSDSFTESDTDSDPETRLTLHLNHIDALSSNITPESLFTLRLHRDAVRVQTLTASTTAVKPNGTGKGFSSSVVSGLAQGSGEYFTRLGVGTPPKNMYMVLDTGSDIIWIQCAPCKKCYSQTDPVFDPRNSTTFSTVPCRSPLCQKLDSPGCNQRDTCLYQVSYGDGSFTVGDFLTETMTFRRTRIEKVGIGCGHDNEGLFVGAAGLLGLGRGKLSFTAQTGNRFGNKFSYCLVDRSASAKPSSVMFGESAVSKNAVFTPLITNPKLDTFYYLDLVGISVGGTRVPSITPLLFKLDPAGGGGVIIDSGTSVTRLTSQAYIALRNAFRIGASGLKMTGGFSLFDTCYDLSGKTEVKVPTVVLHFTGANVPLPATNYLIPVDSNGVFCFAFAGTMSGLSIIGNIQQQGFRVSFDLAKSQVGFTPRGCA